MKGPIRGFSLAELLFVILIIVTLVMIMMPVFVKSKDSSKEVVCISNIRQLMAAMKLYQADFDEYPPSSQIFPAFRTYCPVVLKCTAKGIDDAVLQNDGGYLLVGFPISSQAPALGFDGAWSALRECRELRGSDIPLVLDLRHAPNFQSSQDQRRSIIVGREDGSVSRLSPMEAHPKARPQICDESKISRVYNY